MCRNVKLNDTEVRLTQASSSVVTTNSIYIDREIQQCVLNVKHYKYYSVHIKYHW